MMTDGPLYKPTVLRDLLLRHGFSLKKQLGQNFLIDGNVLAQIADAADLSVADGVFEIGPGAGVVTEMLAERAKQVVSVEKDESLRPVLAESLRMYSNTQVIFQDVLTADLQNIWETYFSDCQSVSVVANLPYYITTPILFHILESGIAVKAIVIMVQKEVADRMMAKPGGKDYGVLSIAVQYRAAVERVTVVHPNSFMPPPGVDSTVICLHCHSQPPVNVEEQDFFKVVRAAFSMRRKTLLNALASGLGVSKDDVRRLLESAGLDATRRGETLSLTEFAELTHQWTDYVRQRTCDGKQ